MEHGNTKHRDTSKTYGPGETPYDHALELSKRFLRTGRNEDRYAAQRALYEARIAAGEL